MAQIKITASQVREGDSIPALDNGYVFEQPETGDGYLSYPRSSSGYQVAMPDDTVIIGFHDAEGEECYLLMPPESSLTVERS